jgi:DNA (cytosine-5)-methyltransferase 1
MANTSGISRGLPKRSERRTLSEVVGCGQADRVGDSDGALGRRNSGSISPEEAKGNREGIFDGRESHELKSAGPVNGFWSDAEWIWCKDGKHRPVEPGSFPLVNGAPGRVGLLRGYGNAINAEVAIEFISAYRKTVSLYE